MVGLNGGSNLGAVKKAPVLVASGNGGSFNTGAGVNVCFNVNATYSLVQADVDSRSAFFISMACTLAGGTFGTFSGPPYVGKEFQIYIDHLSSASVLKRSVQIVNLINLVTWPNYPNFGGYLTPSPTFPFVVGDILRVRICGDAYYATGSNYNMNIRGWCLFRVDTTLPDSDGGGAYVSGQNL